MMALRIFVCEACHKEFCVPSDWTEEDAQTEAERAFPTMAPADKATVCSTCYTKLMKYIGLGGKTAP